MSNVKNKHEARTKVVTFRVTPSQYRSLLRVDSFREKLNKYVLNLIKRGAK
jgi:hypothetical protein